MSKLEIEAIPEESPKRRRLKPKWVIIGSVVTPILGLVGWILFQFLPGPAIVVSKETTFITEPLADDELPDYEAYFLEIGFEGVTPENNAAVLLWKVLWPGDLDPRYHGLMCRALGMEIPKEEEALVPVYDDRVLETIASWIAENTQMPQDVHPDDWEEFVRYEAAESVVDEAGRAPWTDEDIPILATWVEQNHAALELLIEATQRKRFYSPPPNYLDGSREGIIATLLPMAQSTRTGTRALKVRAMWFLGKGMPEAAWKDLQVSLQLAQFNAQGNHLVQHLVAIALEGATLPQVVQILNHKGTSETLTVEILSHLQRLPRFPNMAETIDHGERISSVEATIGFATGRSNAMNSIGESLMGGSADFNSVLRKINEHFDRLVDAGRIPSRTDRCESIVEIDKQMMNLGSNYKNPAQFLGAFLSRSKRSDMIANVFLALLTPALEVAFEAQDRADAYRDLMIVATALAVYRARHGDYPEQLDQLSPEILDSVPPDIFSEEPFIYQPQPDGGYLLYSVFVNGIDDGGTDLGGEIVNGQWVDEPQVIDREQSDLVIRVPMPEFKLPALSGE